MAFSPKEKKDEAVALFALCQPTDGASCAQRYKLAGLF